MAEKEKKRWYPLAEMLELHSPAAVATAIEESGILVVNRYGGKATAENSSKDDIYSKQYALELVAERFGELGGNWRMTFTFDGTDAVLVDYQDYH